MDMPETGKSGMLPMMVVAILGGVAAQANEFLNGKKLSWKIVIGRAIVSAFIGAISFYLLPKDSPWSAAAGGLFAWLGADGIALLVKMLKGDK